MVDVVEAGGNIGAGLAEILGLEPAIGIENAFMPVSVVDGSFYSASYTNSVLGVRVEIINISGSSEHSVVEKVNLKCPPETRCVLDPTGNTVDSLSIVKQPYALIGLSPNAPMPINLR